MSICKSAWLAWAIGFLPPTAEATPEAAPAALVQLASADSSAAALPSAASAPAAGPPSFAYQSAFEGYRRYADEPLANWRKANDQVGRIGDRPACAREALEDKGSTGDACHDPARPASPKPNAPAGSESARPASDLHHH